MSKWKVSICYRTWDIHHVEAETEQEAIEIARNIVPNKKVVANNLDAERWNDQAEQIKEEYNG